MAMNQRAVTVFLLVVALAAVVAPVVIAALAFARGDTEGALAVFGPVLLIPVAFVLVGLAWSFRRDRRR